MFPRINLGTFQSSGVLCPCAPAKIFLKMRSLQTLDLSCFFLLLTFMKLNNGPIFISQLSRTKCFFQIFFHAVNFSLIASHLTLEIFICYSWNFSRRFTVTQTPLSHTNCFTLVHTFLKLNALITRGPFFAILFQSRIQFSVKITKSYRITHYRSTRVFSQWDFQSMIGGQIIRTSSQNLSCRYNLTYFTMNSDHFPALVHWQCSWHVLYFYRVFKNFFCKF